MFKGCHYAKWIGFDVQSQKKIRKREVLGIPFRIPERPRDRI